MTEDEAIAGLKAGRTLMVDRRDCPLSPRLLDMAAAGVLDATHISHDEQSSAIRFKWRAA
jgi:hypothetical protein